MFIKDTYRLPTGGLFTAQSKTSLTPLPLKFSVIPPQTFRPTKTSRNKQASLLFVCANLEAYERAFGSTRSSANNDVSSCPSRHVLPGNFSRELFRRFKTGLFTLNFCRAKIPSKTAVGLWAKKRSDPRGLLLPKTKTNYY